MSPVFGDAWPAEERSRRREAQQKASRFAFVHGADDKQNGHAHPRHLDPPRQPARRCLSALIRRLPHGFVQYQILHEEGALVLYVFELQVAEAARGRGVGKFLMMVMELLSKKARKTNPLPPRTGCGPSLLSPMQLGLEGVMLTVQKANPRAMEFYLIRCRYRIDPISPSLVRPQCGHVAWCAACLPQRAPLRRVTLTARMSTPMRSCQRSGHRSPLQLLLPPCESCTAQATSPR